MKHQKDKLLELFALDKYYHDGKGDVLFYGKEHDKKTEVLDLCGSYGINLLGHKNEVIQTFSKEFSKFPPNFLQGSIHQEKQLLTRTLIAKIAQHTGLQKWEVEYANTGTEIIEVAIKLLSLHYQRKKEKVLQELYYTMNFYRLNSNTEDKILACKKAIETIQSEVFLAHFENSFHGKSSGSLSIMGNQEFKAQFPTAVKAISLSKKAVNVERQLQEKCIIYSVIDSKTGQEVKKEFFPVLGIFIEAIQGEAGVFVLENDLLQCITNFKKELKIPVISDEIQCGLYRTGKFSALPAKNLIADIYCFGKALGAGIAKISALCCHQDLYSKYFFEYHSSSFGEDFMSSWAANQFFKIIDENHLLVQKIEQNELGEQLKDFAKNHQDFIKEVRGKGHLLAIEFQEKALNTAFITKYFKDLKKLGYWLSSVLLNRENIRLLPTLSNPLSFRIQPSIYFTEQQLKQFLSALNNLIIALKKQDINYLFGHLFDVNSESKIKKLPHSLQNEYFPENAAVFICHPIDSEHICSIVDLIDSYPEDDLNKILDEVSDIQDFTVYHVDELKNQDGKSLPIVYLGVPLTSTSFYHALRGGKRDIWIQKIQRAVDWANSKNAKSIGLGQFTSIVTGNGMFLHSSKAILTTGNAYTAALSIKAVEKALKESGKNLKNSDISFIGAGGNIVSVMAKMLCENCRKITLIYHADYRNSKETRIKLLDFVNYWIQLPTNRTNHLFVNDENLEEFLFEIKHQIAVEFKLDQLLQQDAIIIGTNDPNAILLSNHVASGTVVADISVPPNAEKALQNRLDIKYIKGGIAALPETNGKEQSLNAVILPFGPGECYACMAETFGLGFQENYIEHHIGDLSPELIKKVQQLMEKEGFDLKRLKVENSI